jgi:hypothetical protein
LTDIADRALADIARAFSQNEIPAQVEAGRAIQALIDRDTNARAAWVSELREVHGPADAPVPEHRRAPYDTPAVDHGDRGFRD